MKLRLDRNDVSDAGVSQLKDLENLEYINLSFTKITDQALTSISKLKNLDKAYYYNTGVKDSNSVN